MTKPRSAPALPILLLAAAALVAAPAGAQSAQAPPAEEEPVEIDAPPAPEAAEREAPPRRSEPAERPVRTAPPVSTEIPSATTTIAPPSVIVEQVPVPVPVPADPLLSANTVEVLPVPDTYNESFNEMEVYPEVTTTVDEGGGLAWPLIVVAILLLLGAIAFLIARGGRRRSETVVHREVEQEAPLPLAPVVPAAPAGRPRIDLRMNPVRAGSEGEGARVEFELTVLNEGPADAQDVRVYSWMTLGGGQDATRALVPPPGHVGTPPVTLMAGEARTLQASVALPRAEIPGNSLLPAVVADVRYRLPGGGEGRTAAAFSVGLPAGDELGPFPLDGTAGLHGGVIALPLGQPVKS